MRAVVQRVRSASVTVHHPDGTEEVCGRIGAGLVVLLGVTHEDTPAVAAKMADKVWNLRIFEDADGAMNRSLADLAADPAGPASGVLVVSQFTLYGDTRKGRRPSFVAAARPEVAEPLVDSVVAELVALGASVQTGRFRTDMSVELVNDGPVTLVVDLG